VGKLIIRVYKVRISKYILIRGLRKSGTIIHGGNAFHEKDATKTKGYSMVDGQPAKAIELYPIESLLELKGKLVAFRLNNIKQIVGIAPLTGMEALQHRKRDEIPASEQVQD